jgi:3-hydroxyacyl-CoA dehydrogenase/enoyl-CoA hydratase/3-hydroxybutyryl-CoA epimerase
VNDEVSLELGRHVREQSRKDLAAEGKTWPAHPADGVVDKMCVELGRKGKAAGAGFYEYPAGGKKFLWPGLAQHFGKPERARPSDADFAEMKDRLLYMPAVETIRCLEEGVLRSVADGNIGSIMGIGAPPWTGGFLQFVNYVGLREFAARAAELAAKHGPRFAPPKLLLAMAEKGETFK